MFEPFTAWSAQAAGLNMGAEEPVKQRAGSQPDIRTASPTSERRPPAPARKSSIWDSFFQYEYEYRGKGVRK